jgi:hypothetical protein
MNPEQQRIAIAEACGWNDIALRIIAEGTGMDQRVWCSGTISQGGRELPNYLNDLNAMHEAEKTLTKANWGGYAAELYRITDAHNHGISPNHHWLAVAFSTAAQRAEAFLRTIGKWEEGK